MKILISPKYRVQIKWTTIVHGDITYPKLLVFDSIIIYFIIVFYRYLIEHGANVAAVNNDGELPIDIAEGDEMEDILSEVMEARGEALNWSFLTTGLPYMSENFKLFFFKYYICEKVTPKDEEILKIVEENNKFQDLSGGHFFFKDIH